MKLQLRELRIRSGKKQKQIAQAISCSSTVYSRYECGERQPDISTLCVLADVFNVSLDELVGRDVQKI